MADEPIVERLTPLDLLMPWSYIPMLLTFRTTESVSAVLPRLQQGLDRLVEHVPWLAGRVYPTTRARGDLHAPGLEIRRDTNEAAPTLTDRGSIAVSYETEAAQGMPSEVFPADIWPVPMVMDESLLAVGAPVLAASLFRFADGQGIGLCIAMHHNAVDGTAYAHVVELWIQSMSGSVLASPDLLRNRLDRLSKSLSSHLPEVTPRPLDSLFASHPEYSRATPVLPNELPPCAARMFTIPATSIDAVRQQLSGHMSRAPTTHTVLSAVLWSAITRVRVRRNPAQRTEANKLALAVNCRGRIGGGDFSTAASPYLGNAVLYALAELSGDELGSCSEPEALAKVCDAIVASHSPKINSQHVAEVCSLVDRSQDYKAIGAGWDLVSGRHLAILSWGHLGLHDMNFGTGLGLAEFVRVPRGAGVDGLCLLLPRRRSVEHQVLEVVVSLRKEDMDALEQDGVWKGFSGWDQAKGSYG